MIGQIACNSARASQALPCCFLAPSVWIFEIGIGRKTTFSCLWEINTILILHRFIIYLVKYCSRIHCVTKLASIDGASLYYALVMVTGSSIARCTGRKPAAFCEWPNALPCTLHCSVVMLLSNHKMFHCNGISCHCVPGDQELLKSGHWNSILRFITMNFIDLVYTEDLIWRSIWACALLWGSKYVLSLCIAPIWNEKYILKSVICVKEELHSPQSINCSNAISVWYSIEVSQGKGLELSRWILQWNSEGAPEQSVARFQSKGGRSGGKASFLVVGGDIHLRVITSDLQVIISDLQGHADCAGGNSTTVLIPLDH